MTQKSQTNDSIVAIICKNLEAVSSISVSLDAETDMTTDTAVDSVAIMDLVFILEEKFDISIPLNDLADINKIGELADLVEKLHNERQTNA